MKKTDTYFKGKIQKINYEFSCSSIEEIIFRIISINDTYFFAEEITTNCIYPIYEFTKGNGDKILFKTTSYLQSGKYFIYYPLVAGDKIFKYKLDNRQESLEGLDIAEDNEVKKYIKNKKNNLKWIDKLQKLEKANNYMCNLTLLKDKIRQLKEGKNILNYNDNTINYENGISKIDIEGISEYGYDLSKQKNLCNLIERENEVKKITKALAIRKKSVLLLGPKGSGKTSIAEKLALDIKNDTCEWLEGKTIISINPASLVSGAHLLGTFESRIKKLIDFCLENQNKIILFIDEIHKLYGLGRTLDSSLDAMNILKPYLSRGEITIIGTTTEEEYQKYMINDPAFLERFENVVITAPTKELNIKILFQYIEELENQYNIKLELNKDKKYKLIDYIIEITEPKNQKVVGDSIKLSNPRISKNIIEDAFTEAIYNKQTKVTIEDFIFSILDCSKLSPTFRKEKAQKLKQIIIAPTQNKSKILQLNK